MSQLTLPRRGVADAAKTGFLDRRMRRAVLSRLAAITDGRLRVSDAFGADSFGGGPTELTAHVEVHDPAFYRRVALGGATSAAESYMDGEWDADDVTAAIRILSRNRDALGRMESGTAKLLAPFRWLAHRLRPNSKAGSRKNIRAHYDLGNDLFTLFLDDTMTYSSGIFPHPRATMREASVEKLDRICRKLALSPSDHVLEIGTGWGSFAMHAAGNYGCRVTTTTISQEQYDLATRRIEEAGLSDRITVLLTDYRDLTGTYDKVVSIEMIEAVGHEYLGDYFGKIGELAGEDGLVLLQAIVMPDHEYDAYRKGVDFIRTHIFPGGCLTSVGAMVASAAGTSGMRAVHLEDITPHYAETLRRWRDRFRRNREVIARRGYPERFLRMWEFYLRFCEAGFAERHSGTVQIAFAGRKAELPEMLRAGEVAA